MNNEPGEPDDFSIFADKVFVELFRAEDGELKNAILAELSGYGLPPKLTYFVLNRLTRKLGGWALNRLGETKIVREALTCLSKKIAPLIKRASARGEVKKALLHELKRGESFDIDDQAELDVLKALYQKQQFEELSEDIKNEFDQINSQLNKLFESLFDPDLCWNQQPAPRTIIDRLRYNSNAYRFVGREKELQDDLIRQFCGDGIIRSAGDQFCWRLVLAEGGQGKSRLALELCEYLKSSNPGWKAGRLSKDDLHKWEPAKWRPRQPTLIVIDYVSQEAEKAHGLIMALHKHCAEFDWPVRLLMLERQLDESWSKKLVPDTSDGAICRQLSIDVLDSGGEKIPAWQLEPMGKDSLLALMRQVASEDGLDITDDQLWALAFEIDGKEGDDARLPRPLFALAVAEWLVQNKWEESTPSRKNVLHSLLQRDREQFWLPAAQGNDHQLRRHEMLLVLVTLCSGMDVKELYNNLNNPGDCGLPEADEFNRDLFNCLVLMNDLNAQPLEPDIIGEYFILSLLEESVKYIGPQSEYPGKLIDLAWERDPIGIARFILRLYQDFPGETAEHYFLLGTGFKQSKLIAHIQSMLIVDLTNVVRESGKWDHMDALIAHLDQLRSTFPDDTEIALAEAQAAVNITTDAGSAGDWERVDNMLSRLDHLRNAFPNHAEIALEEAKAAFNIISDAGSAGDWERVDTMFSRFDDIRKVFPNHAEIALTEAKAAFNITTDAGSAGDWERVDNMLSRLDHLRNAFPNHAEIALEEAKAAVNIANRAGSSKDWGRIDRILSRLDDIRRIFPGHAEIALAEAKAALNIISDAGSAGDWARVDRMLSRLDDIRRVFPDSAEIALEEAQAAFNITTDAGSAGDWERVDNMLSRLDHLRNAFPNHAEIALEEAKAAVNIANRAGSSKDWGRIDRILSRLDDIRRVFPDDAEIALTEAQAAFNMTNHAGPAGDWGRVDTMFLRLDHLRNAFPNHAEIALAEAQAAVNIANHAGSSKDWARVDTMFSRLDDIRRVFPDSAEIALEEAKAAFNITNHAGPAGDWARVDNMFSRLDDIRRTFPDHTEIALLEANAAFNITTDAGSAGDWERVDTMFLRLDHLRNAFPNHAEIALAEAQAAANLIVCGLKAGDEELVKKGLGRLQSVHETFPYDQEIYRIVEMIYKMFKEG